MAHDSLSQVLGLLIEVMRGNFQRHVDPILVVVGWILHSAVDVGLHQEQDCSDEVTLPFWNDAYYSLVMLEKLLYQFRDLCFKRELEVQICCCCKMHGYYLKDGVEFTMIWL